MAHEASFGVQNAREFLEQVILPQYQEFVKDTSSVRHALLCTVVAYHMHEWVYLKPFEEDEFKKRTGKPVVAECFEIARRITNGTKHFKSKITTRKQRGFSSAFSTGFAVSGLIAEMIHSSNEITADELIDKLVSYWKEQRDKGMF